MGRRSLGWMTAFGVLAGLGLGAGSVSAAPAKAVAAKPAAKAANPLKIVVLSSAPSRVTGGDALLEIVGSAKARIAVDGADVTDSFTTDAASGHLRGLVKGLKEGTNTVTASAGAAKATLTLTDYPLAGPVFSGPHQTPFVCETQAFKLPDGKTLGPAQDADCFAPTNVQWVYKPTGSEQLKPYDPTGPKPADLARTKTTTGADVDYIVRLETGVINRAIYQIALLATPGGPLPTPTSSTPGWNGALVYSFGGGCGAAYRQGRGTGGVTNGGEMQNDPLTMGFAVASATLNVLGQNCNDVTSAETAMMVKEHFTEEFGPPKHTIGLGGSGGALQQNLIAENYPGILDGILPERSGPDIHSVILGAADCPLIDNYFDKTSLTWTDQQKAAVVGYPTIQHCIKAWGNYLPRQVSPLGSGCDSTAFITADEGGALAGTKGAAFSSALYDPVKSPKGVRCSIFDNASNVFGTHPDGSARTPLDNVGVQYGLKAYNAGDISFEQFLDLNRKVGGYDSDANVVPARMKADPEALRISYATGRENQGVGMNLLPIIDVRSYVENTIDVHTGFTTEVARARWKAANGSAANFVAWRTDTIGNLGMDTRQANSPLRQAMRMALTSMDMWLNTLEADKSVLPKAQKIVKDKPKDVIDACFTTSMQKIAMHPGAANDECAKMFPDHSDPRVVAGEPLVRLTLKCALQPVNPALYKRKLTAAQLQSVKEVFPQGVCDYSKPPIGSQKLAGTWLSYPAPGTFKVSSR